MIYELTYIVPYTYSFETYYLLHVIALSNRHMELISLSCTVVVDALVIAK